MTGGSVTGRSRLTRREAIAAGAAGTAALYGWNGLAQALAARPRECAALSDIEHVVIFVQENRSFDHYFGTFPGVRGFEDPEVKRLPGGGASILHQPGYEVPGYHHHLLPFHLDSHDNGECTHDINHDWGPQHRSWHQGKMDRFLREHLEVDGPDYGTLTMGYYERDDLDYYFALAEAFTLCDGYHCSVIGPTDPNQLYLISATLDPAGRHGGPLLETLTDRRPIFDQTTMPEQLRERGISWKAYLGADNFSPVGDTPLTLFKQYYSDGDLAADAFTHSFPGDFQTDAASGDLPQVSWIWASIVQSEHPPAPPDYGAVATDQILSALTGNPELWAKTALFITWDENGGFFDHVQPLTPPPGTRGEHVTARPLPEAAEGIAGPIGLGFRVPMLVVSPFSRGGFVCSERFDHTSLLQFLEARFGAEVPNISTWRRKVAGDLTGAFNFAEPDASVPDLPSVSLADPDVIASDCPIGPLGLTGAPVPPYPVPPNRKPQQEHGRARRPSGACRRHRHRH